MARAYTDPILFGAAYYDEYIPRDLDRIDTDMEMMTRAGINVIRIGESTWSTCEPQPGHFDWTHIDRALDAATNAGINVIVGTPTYAVPTWLVAMYPDVLATTPAGEPHYGARQIMNIVNPAYRLYGERVIRSLISHVAQQPCVIGYQVDNETKYYDSVSHDMQVMFIKQLRHEFKNDLEALNEAYGLDYWSNRINAWEDFPDLTGSINESLRARFDRFRRDQVAEYLAWQASIIREYMRDDQFITHNFDYEWRGHSYGLQPAVDHFRAARALDICGVDIYHPSEDALTGKEIAFGGDMARSAGGGNYLVLETQAQGQHGWLPYPGQLRLQAYSHLASGADGIMYWHWHSIHNSFETYWRGLLSHDFESNPTYEEAGRFGREIGDPRIGDTLSHLSKRNAVAILASNESLTALSWFHIETGFPMGGTLTYNDVLRSIYDALFELNVEVDFLPADASADQLAGYSLVIAPALYTTDQQTIDRLARYVKNGGHLLATMRSFVADENVKVWHDKAPHHLVDIFGMTYNQFTRPMGVSLKCPDTWPTSPARLQTTSSRCSPRLRKPTYSLGTTIMPGIHMRRSPDMHSVPEMRSGWARSFRRMHGAPCLQRPCPTPACTPPAWNWPAQSACGAEPTRQAIPLPTCSTIQGRPSPSGHPPRERSCWDIPQTTESRPSPPKLR
jgi:beta-galactosidase